MSGNKKRKNDEDQSTTVPKKKTGPKPKKSKNEEAERVEVIPIVYELEPIHPFYGELNGQYRSVPINLILEYKPDVTITREEVL